MVMALFCIRSQITLDDRLISTKRFSQTGRFRILLKPDIVVSPNTHPFFDCNVKKVLIYIR